MAGKKFSRKKIRIGIVGCGRIADLQCLGYLDHPRAEIVAVCDSAVKRAQSRAKQWGAAHVYKTLDGLLKNSTVDAVDICTPHHLHAHQAIAALEAGKQLGATVINMRFIKPIDEEIILAMAKSHDVLITIEENVLAGGAGSAVNEFLQAQKILMQVLNIALPDRFVEQGTREELLTECELDTKGILSSIEKFCA